MPLNFFLYCVGLKKEAPGNRKRQWLLKEKARQERIGFRLAYHWIRVEERVQQQQNVPSQSKKPQDVAEDSSTHCRTRMGRRHEIFATL